MHPVQIAALIVLVIGAGAYVVLRVARSTRADEEFFGALIDRLSQVLTPKGFVVSRRVRAHFAVFEGAGTRLEAIWDGREREVLLQQRESDDNKPSRSQRLAVAHVRDGASATDYGEAGETIVKAAESIDGAA